MAGPCVPRVYLGCAFLAILAPRAICETSNLRGCNLGSRFESLPLRQSLSSNVIRAGYRCTATESLISLRSQVLAPQEKEANAESLNLHTRHHRR
jgi:hypothetical protein